MKELLDMTPAELSAEVEALGEPAYRAGQIAAWIWKKWVCDSAEMTDLPSALRGTDRATPALAAESASQAAQSVVFGLLFAPFLPPPAARVSTLRQAYDRMGRPHRGTNAGRSAREVQVTPRTREIARDAIRGRRART